MIIYTCISKDFDWLLPPIFNNSDIRYICFSDRPNEKVAGWEMRPIDPSLLESYTANMVNRRYKFMPWDYLPPHEWSLYVDANIRVLRDPRPLIANSRRSDTQILIPMHIERTDIWREFEACVRLGVISGPAVRVAEDRLALYAADGFDNRNMLTANGIIFRSGDPTKIRTAMEMWWNELHYFAGRDQISLPYVAWKLGLPLEVLSISAMQPNPYFAIVDHKRGVDSLVNYIGAKRFHGRRWMYTYAVLRAARCVLRRGSLRDPR